MTTNDQSISRRNVLLGTTLLVTASTLAQTVPRTAMAQAAAGKPNILVIFGDDIGTWNVSAYSNGLMGKTPNIDRLAAGGVSFEPASPGTTTDHIERLMRFARSGALVPLLSVEHRHDRRAELFDGGVGPVGAVAGQRGASVLGPTGRQQQIGAHRGR